MPNKILIVSDYSNDVGGAHLVRDAQLASKLADLGANPTLLVPDNAVARRDVPTLGLPETVKVQFKEGMTFQPKGAPTFSPFPDRVLATIPLRSYKTIIVDSYRATAEQLAGLKQRMNGSAVLVVIDDSNARGLDQSSAHMIVNVNLPRGAVNYGRADSVHVPDYHMVKPAFFEDRAIDPNQVFMAFSGLDDGRVAVALLDEMSKLSPDLGHPNLKFRVALKTVDPKYMACALGLTKKYGDRIEFVQRYDGPKIMGESGLFVGNMGQVSFEAISSGLPIIGLFALGEKVPAMESYYQRKGIPVVDISGIMNGVDRGNEIGHFAHKILPLLSNRAGIKLEHPLKDGFKTLAWLINGL